MFVCCISLFLLICLIGCLMSQFLFQLLVCWKECVCVLFGMIDESCVKERGKERKCWRAGVMSMNEGEEEEELLV